MRTTHRLWITAAALVLAACGGDGGTTGPGGREPVARVVVAPAEAHLPVGATHALNAVAQDEAGGPLPGRAIAWASSNPTVAEVSAAGVVTGRAAGTATITATSEGKRGEARVVVDATNPVPVADALAPASAAAGAAAFTLTVSGAGFAPQAVVTWNGAPRPTTYVGTREVRVQVGAADVAAAGQAQVAVVNPAPGGGASNAVVFTITPPVAGPVARVELDATALALEEGTDARLRATARDAQGNEVTGRAVQWTTSDESVAMVAPDGTVRAVRPGRAAVTARVDGQRAAASVEVSASYAYDLVYDGWNGVGGQPRELFTLDIRVPEGQAARIPLAATASHDVAVSPDGRKIAFTGVVDGVRGIYTADRDGGGIRRLTWDATDADPTWSPDGARIAFRRWPQGQGSDVWVMNADGTGAVNLTPEPGNHRQEAPAWSPRLADGGSRIAYAHVENGEARIHSMRPDGSDKRPVTTTPGVYDTEPAWSPDGTTLVFQRSGAAYFGDLFLVDAGGGRERRLLPAELSFGQFGAAWSPDGRLIAFASKHHGDGTYQIYTVRADGSRLARRTFDALDKQSPAWITR